MNEPWAYTDPQDSSWPGVGGIHHLPPYCTLCDMLWKLHPSGVFPKTPMSRVLQFLKLKLLPLWTPITCTYFWLRWGLKKSYSPFWKLSDDIWHTSYMHIIQGDSQFLMVKSQIDTLIPNLFFGHNLCYKYSNGSYEPILNTQVLRNFQWYKEALNSMSFDPSNHFLNIQKSNRTPNPKVGVHVRVCELIPSHFFALSKVWMWLPSYTCGPHLSMPLLWSQA
jgi:hypothetical protein